MFLFKVEETFLITGRGLILTPGLGDNLKFATTGTPIILIRPNQTVLLANIRGVSFQGSHDVLVGGDLTKEDVPIGTEVWLDK
jgi:hypothetical protein